ncbi:unnamed protein product, partial [Brassica oleracea]
FTSLDAGCWYDLSSTNEKFYPLFFLFLFSFTPVMFAQGLVPILSFLRPDPEPLSFVFPDSSWFLLSALRPLLTQGFHQTCSLLAGGLPDLFFASSGYPGS